MSRLPGLDLLRAIAIIWVMLTHAYLTGLAPEGNPVIDLGWMGVDLFFALSGYLIGGQLFRPYAKGEPEHIGLFYFRRLFRTLPPYLVVVALYFLWPDFREQPTIMPPWQFLTFTENLFIDFAHPRAFSHVWSLCVEEQFYLFTPLIVWLLMRRPAAWKAITLFLAIVGGGMALRGYIWMHDVAPLKALHSGWPVNQAFMERIYYPTWTRLDGLTGGVALAALRAFWPSAWARVGRHANLILAAGLVLVAVAIWLFMDERTFASTVIGYPILAAGMTALVAAGAQARSLIGRWRVPGAGAVAAMAYSLYLTHKPIYHLVRQAVGAQMLGHPHWGFVVYGGAALAGGALLYFTFERPALILRDRLLHVRRHRAARAAVS